MNTEEAKSLKKSDIFTVNEVNSHNESILFYQVNSSEKRNIGWVVSVNLFCKKDFLQNGRMNFYDKKLGFSLSDDEIKKGVKRGSDFLRSEIEGVFNGS